MGDRLEIDEEESERLAAQAAWLKDKDKRDQAEFERLKKKFS